MLVLAAGLLVGACGGGGGAGGGGDTTATASTTVAAAAGTVLVVEEIPRAVAAVEALLGGPQRYTEINVTPEEVNLFVATEDGRELDYVVPAGGEPQPPGEPVAQVGPPFALDGVDLGAPAGLVAEVQERFPGAVVVQVALVSLPDQGVVWALQHRSALGGRFNTFYAPDGRLLGGGPIG